eukprot:5739798-Prymnesium_polylepis.1
MLDHVKTVAKVSTENNRREMRGGATVMKDRRAQGRAGTGEVVTPSDRMGARGSPSFETSPPKQSSRPQRPMATPLVATSPAPPPSPSVASSSVP